VAVCREAFLLASSSEDEEQSGRLPALSEMQRGRGADLACARFSLAPESVTNGKVHECAQVTPTLKSLRLQR